jgi:eukaryotic-like serine/threonine-protein kinase
LTLSPGTRLGPYEVTALLGVGGMGEVYRARDTRLDRTVAIKVLPSVVTGDPDVRSRFEREARAVAALDHPHICGIYDVGSVDGTHYLVMPHLDGQTLAARLEKGSLPLDQALKIAVEIADALDKAHRLGITHRDVKPANIMLTKTGSKLLDFGLAKLKAPTGPISMSGMTRLATVTPQTATGSILGTIHYMAPEQVEGRETDARSDIWALGVVLYEMTTGTRPFNGESPASIIGAILKDTPAPSRRTSQSRLQSSRASSAPVSRRILTRAGSQPRIFAGNSNGSLRASRQRHPNRRPRVVLDWVACSGPRGLAPARWRWRSSSA